MARSCSAISPPTARPLPAALIGPASGCPLHFTPTDASWLNLVEQFFELPNEKALKRGAHTSNPPLRAAILAYVERHNDRGHRSNG